MLGEESKKAPFLVFRFVCSGPDNGKAKSNADLNGVNPFKLLESRYR